MNFPLTVGTRELRHKNVKNCIDAEQSACTLSHVTVRCWKNFMPERMSSRRVAWECPAELRERAQSTRDIVSKFRLGQAAERISAYADDLEDRAKRPGQRRIFEPAKR